MKGFFRKLDNENRIHPTDFGVFDRAVFGIEKRSKARSFRTRTFFNSYL